MKVMHSVEEVVEILNSGKVLFLAGDEQQLKQLPRGKWIAGTIPYFMAESGGEFSQNKIYVTELPETVTTAALKTYSQETLPSVYKDLPENGFGFIVIPATSQTHLEFALKGPGYEGFGISPLIGWISGVNLDDLGKVTPKIFNGETGEVLEEGAVVIQADLPPNKAADINIINIFEQSNGDELTFPKDGFNAKTVLVNGVEQNFADYISEKKIDTRLPLVADYYGASVNISFQSVDEDNKEVLFYAPVFAGMKYKHAAVVKDYMKAFTTQIEDRGSENMLFSCNCILNYLYAELEGKQTGHITGPITFGEIAHQLLNQTLVYLKIYDVG